MDHVTVIGKENSTEILIRSSLWFPDGSIVFRAENTLFRVYKGILATQSAFFRSMFELSQGEMGNERLIEGCRIITVYDPAKDFEALLRAMVGHE